jgi:GNAT superfamily N-acetyltransferase
MRLTPTPWVVREATAHQARDLARLRYAFRAEVGAAAESLDEFLDRCERWIRERLERDGDWHCWTAESAGTLVGTAWLRLIEKLPNPVAEPEWHGYLTSVYVVPEHRGGGIGRALLESCLAECDRRGVDAVFLWAAPRSRPLYLREGFAPADDLLQRRASVIQPSDLP